MASDKDEQQVMDKIYLKYNKLVSITKETGHESFKIWKDYFFKFVYIASNRISMIPYTPNNLNQKNDKNSEKTTSGLGEDITKKENQNETVSKHHEPTMMIGTPIFFSNIWAYF